MDARPGESDVELLRIGTCSFEPQRCRLVGPGGIAALRPKTSEVLHHHSDQ